MLITTQLCEVGRVDDDEILVLRGFDVRGHGFVLRGGGDVG
jgi:hypothetical protein